MSKRIGDHAVVLGAGMAGLLAAGVLAQAYGRVTVFDRDSMPEIGVPRRGVPQDRHVHALHPRGRQALEEFFPGLIAQLISQGAVTGDVLGNGRWQLPGINLPKQNKGIPVGHPTGPFMRASILAR